MMQPGRAGNTNCVGQAGPRRRRVKLAGWNSGDALTAGDEHHACTRRGTKQPARYHWAQWRCPAWPKARLKFNFTPRAFAALQSKRKRPLQPLGKARVHVDELLAGPGAELRIPRVGVDEEIIGDVESHGRAAWVGLLVLVKAPPLISARGRARSRDRVAARAESGYAAPAPVRFHSLSVFIVTRIGKPGGPMFSAIFPSALPTLAVALASVWLRAWSAFPRLRLVVLGGVGSSSDGGAKANLVMLAVTRS